MTVLNFLSCVIVCALSLVGVILACTVFVKTIRNGASKKIEKREDTPK